MISKSELLRLPLSQLRILRLFLRKDRLTSREIGRKLGIEGRQLGRVLGGISQRKTPPICPVGQKSRQEGLIWKLDHKVISKEVLRQVIEEVFEE